MKHFLQSLLAILALGLCALCAAQWVREARLRTELGRDKATIAEKETAFRNLESARQRLETDLLSLDGRIATLRDSGRTNELVLLELRQGLNKAQSELDASRAQNVELQKALTQANANIERNNTTIRDQYKLLQDLAAQRDDFLKKLNDMTRQYNELVEKYNALVKQIEAAQSGRTNQ